VLPDTPLSLRTPLKPSRSGAAASVSRHRRRPLA
jgi:hypothetical protein